MKILLATGLFPPDVGGPAQYAAHLADEFCRQGYDVSVIKTGFERRLPAGMRHMWYFFRLIWFAPKADVILALDTFSVGLPAVWAGMIFRRPVTIRIGGDFLWEQYVERSGNLIPLPHFYEQISSLSLSLKERVILALSRFVVRHTDACVFNTKWQREIWRDAYRINNAKLFTILNFYGTQEDGILPSQKTFLWGGRPIRLKNRKALKTAFENAQRSRNDITLDMVTGMPYEAFLERIRSCYAVIVPSISEVHPNIIMDAIRFKKPFIVTKYSGITDSLGDIGIFVDPLDVDDITEKILFLADDNNYAEYKNRIAGFHFTHSWDEITDEYVAVMNAVL